LIEWHAGLFHDFVILPAELENREKIKRNYEIRTGVSGVSEGSRGNRPGGLLLV
jgi:hypothetical protein